MNHLGDTNKMVGEDVSNEQMTAHATPNEELRRQILSHVVPKNEREWWASRTIEKLERELNAANESFKKLNLHALNLTDHIRRLKNAGDDMEKLLPEGCICDKAAIRWIKTKNDKL